MTVHDILATFTTTDDERRKSMDEIIQARVSGKIESEESMLKFMAQRLRQQLNANKE